MLPCVLAAHMDETVWDSPKKFKPERWLDSGGNLIKRDDTLGFGAGKHLKKLTECRPIAYHFHYRKKAMCRRDVC